MKKSSAIIIPVLSQNISFKGQPFHQLSDKAILMHVYQLANYVAQETVNCSLLIVTDNKEVAEFSLKNNLPVHFIKEKKLSTCDALVTAVHNLSSSPDIIVNLSLDYPLLPSSSLKSLLDEAYYNLDCCVAQLGVRLNWEQLQAWRVKKNEQKCRGISIIVDEKHNLKWCSRAILPLVHDESKLQAKEKYSPVCRYIDVTAYSYQLLKTLTRLNKSHYEVVENINLLRLVENGYQIKVIEVKTDTILSCQPLDSMDMVEQYEKVLRNKETVK